MKPMTTPSIFLKALTVVSLLIVVALPLDAQKRDVKPLRVLLITGGCCHAYATQQHILKNGLEARAHVIVDQVHSDDTSNNPPLAFYGNPDYAKGYDVIIHDECAAKMADVETLKAILAPHRDGTPGVNLHCSMHSYRVGDHKVPSDAGTDGSLWFDYLGVQSSGHGPKQPIIIDFTRSKNVITKGLEDWATGPEELYNNVQIFPSAKDLATGSQHQPERKLKTGKTTPAQDAEAVVVWTNDYNGTRVFSTTIGHYDETVADDRYLDLVTRGLLWSCKKLNKNYLK
jgi:type 1 glutamine amidotransferase